jgi:hypothetical protein
VPFISGSPHDPTHYLEKLVLWGAFSHHAETRHGEHLLWLVIRFWNTGRPL